VTQALRDAPQHSSPSQSARRPWYGSAWVRVTAAGGLVIVVAVAAGLGWGKGSTPTGATTGSRSHQTQQPGAAAQSAEQRKKDATAQDLAAAREDARATGGPAAGASGTWLVGSVGTYSVGRGIRPGTYRSAAPASGQCHWSRMRGLRDAASDVIADRSAAGPSVVRIKSTDKFFVTTNCANWQRIR
jgi:hypothetical protein